jgi:hypothetical protein
MKRTIVGYRREDAPITFCKTCMDKDLLSVDGWKIIWIHSTDEEYVCNLCGKKIRTKVTDISRGGEDVNKTS